MLAQCAGGDSRRQVLDAIGAEDPAALQNQVEHIWRALYTDDGVSSLILANSVWLNSNMQGTYIQDTLDTLAQKYYAGAYSVPMGTDGADAAVTQWVNAQTKGLIGSDAPVVQTDTLTLALLVSSLYYKAAWQNEFMPERTEIDTFTDAAGQETQVDFMHRTEDANFIRREGYQAARLSTHLGEMVFVLPDEGVSPASLLKEPDFLSRLEFYGDACIWGEVQWSVPKFDVNSDLDLLETLAALGITDLTDPDRADLSALTDLDAFLSDAKQLARVKVDEEGGGRRRHYHDGKKYQFAAPAHRGVRHGPGPALPVRHSDRGCAPVRGDCESGTGIKRPPCERGRATKWRGIPFTR